MYAMNLLSSFSIQDREVEEDLNWDQNLQRQQDPMVGKMNHSDEYPLCLLSLMSRSHSLWTQVIRQTVNSSPFFTKDYLSIISIRYGLISAFSNKQFIPFSPSQPPWSWFQSVQNPLSLNVSLKVKIAFSSRFLLLTLLVVWVFETKNGTGSRGKKKKREQQCIEEEIIRSTFSFRLLSLLSPSDFLMFCSPYPRHTSLWESRVFYFQTESFPVPFCEANLKRTSFHSPPLLFFSFFFFASWTSQNLCVPAFWSFSGLREIHSPVPLWSPLDSYATSCLIQISCFQLPSLYFQSSFVWFVPSGYKKEASFGQEAIIRIWGAHLMPSSDQIACQRLITYLSKRGKKEGGRRGLTPALEHFISTVSLTHFHAPDSTSCSSSFSKSSPSGSPMNVSIQKSSSPYFKDVTGRKGEPSRDSLPLDPCLISFRKILNSPDPIANLVSCTHFDRRQVKLIYRNFKQVKPSSCRWKIIKMHWHENAPLPDNRTVLTDSLHPKSSRPFTWDSFRAEVSH